MGQPPSRYHLVAMAGFVVVIAAGELLPGMEGRLLRWAGVATLASSLPLWILPFFHLSRHGAPEEGKGFTHTTQVVRRGLYGVVRHPQYLGYMLLTTGFVLIGLNTVSALAGGVAIVAFFLAAREEERYLTRHLGDEYRSYAEDVPRFNLVAGWLRRRRRGDA